MRALRSVRLTMALVAVLALGAAACGDDDEESSGQGEGTAAVATVKKGTLTVCSDIPYAPFEFEEGGKQVGIDLDVVRAIGDELSLRVAVKDTDFDGIFAALAARQCDLIASAVSITDERKQNNEFTQGYFEIRQSLLVRAEDEEKYASLDDLAGRTVGVQSETTGEAYAKEHGEDVTLKSYTGADEMFTALKAGQIDGIVQDLPVNAYHAKATGETAVSATFESEPETYGFVIRKGNTELRDAVDDALTKVKDDGRLDKILKTYLGEDAP